MAMCSCFLSCLILCAMCSPVYCLIWLIWLLDQLPHLLSLSLPSLFAALFILRCLLSCTSLLSYVPLMFHSCCIKPMPALPFTPSHVSFFVLIKPINCTIESSSHPSTPTLTHEVKPSCVRKNINILISVNYKL